MRDTVLTSKWKKRELFILLIAFIAANIINLIGILIYGTHAKELITKLPVVILVTLFLYAVVAGVRVVWWFFTGIYKAFNRS